MRGRGVKPGDAAPGGIGLNHMRACRIALAALALCSCGSPKPPAINAAPARLLRVHGTVDRSLTIAISTQYVSTDDDCRVGTSLWGSPGKPRSQWIESAVARSAEGYEATVSFDYFAQDDCAWFPFVIAFQVTNQAGLSTGRYVSSAGGTRHVPGPEGKVWISAPERAGSTPLRNAREGASFMRPLELFCTRNIIREVQSLSCIPDSLRELPLVNGEATQVRVDFRDRT